MEDYELHLLVNKIKKEIQKNKLNPTLFLSHKLTKN